MGWLDNLLKPWRDSKFSNVIFDPAKYSSIQHLVLISLKVIGHISVKDCVRSQPIHDIRHTLSYFVKPLNAKAISCILPSKRLQGGKTVYFDNESCEGNEELWGAMKDLIRDFIPSWLKHNHNAFSDEQLLKHIIHWEHKYWDPFLVREGSSFKRNKALIPLTRSTQPGPRRLNLHDKIDNEKFSKRYIVLQNFSLLWTIPWKLSWDCWVESGCLESCLSIPLSNI